MSPLWVHEPEETRRNTGSLIHEAWTACGLWVFAEALSEAPGVWGGGSCWLAPPPPLGPPALVFCLGSAISTKCSVFSWNLDVHEQPIHARSAEFMVHEVVCVCLLLVWPCVAPVVREGGSPLLAPLLFGPLAPFVGWLGLVFVEAPSGSWVSTWSRVCRLRPQVSRALVSELCTIGSDPVWCT